MSESISFWQQVETPGGAFKIVAHPPLYPIVLSLFASLFNSTFLSGYFVGILSVVISGWLIVLIMMFHERNLSQNYLSVFMVLIGYYSLPIVIQGSFIYDIDNTILTPLLLLVYLTYLNFSRQPGWQKGTLFFLALTVSFWSKLTTPYLLLFSVGFFHLIKRDFKFLFIKLIPVSLGAIILFYVSYGWLYTKFVLKGYGSFQFNSGKTWDLLSGKNTFQLSFSDLLFSVSSNIGALVVWSSPLILFVILILILQIKKGVVRQYFSTNSSHPLAKYSVPLILIATTLIVYTVVLKIQASAGFPKYHYPLFSFLYIIIGHRVVKSDLKFGKFELIYFPVVFLFYYFFIKDHLFPFYVLGREKQTFQLAIYLVKITVLLVLPIVLYSISKRTSILRNSSDFIFALLVFLTLANISSLASRTQADYSTNFHYGISGTEDALDYANIIPIKYSVYFPFVGYFIRKHPDYDKSLFGRLLGDDYLKPDSNYLIMSDPMLKRNRYVFNYSYVLKKYHRIKTIKSYGVWKNKDQSE